jgi:hypothetical protein
MARLIIAAALLLGSAGYAAAQFFPLGLGQTISAPTGATAYLVPGFGVIDNQTGTTARLLPGFGVIRIE